MFNDTINKMYTYFSILIYSRINVCKRTKTSEPQWEVGKNIFQHSVVQYSNDEPATLQRASEISVCSHTRCARNSVMG